MLRFLSVSLAVLALAFGASPGVASNPESQDLVVSQDTRMADRTLQVRDLVVASGTTLTLHGTTLLVGGKVVVEPGAVLALGPSGNAATRLLPLDAAAGFWIDVQGNLSTAGFPASEVSGLNGEGLAVAAGGPGGIQLAGGADLHALHLHDAGAGLLVKPGASLTLRASVIERSGFSAVTAFGDVAVSDSRLSGVSIPVLAKREGEPCRLRVEDTTLDALVGGLQSNGCDLDMRRTQVRAAATGMFLNGAIEVRLATVHLQGYAGFGVLLERGVNVTLTDVVLDGNGTAKGGVKANPGNRITLEGGRVAGHVGDGLTLQDAAFVARNATVTGNGGHGVRLVRGSYAGTLADLGGEPADNGLALLSHVAVASVQAVDRHGVPLPGLDVEVVRNGVHLMRGTTGTGPLQAHYDLYGPDEAGGLVHLGPATYRAGHAWLATPQEGPFGLDTTSVTVLVEMPQEPGGHEAAHGAAHGGGAGAGRDAPSLGLLSSVAGLAGLGAAGRARPAARAAAPSPALVKTAQT